MGKYDQTFTRIVLTSNNSGLGTFYDDGELEFLYEFIHKEFEKKEWGSRFPLLMHKLLFYKLEFEKDMYKLQKEVKELEKCVHDIKPYLEKMMWCQESKKFTTVKQGFKNYYEFRWDRLLWHLNDVVTYYIDLLEGREVDPTVSDEYTPDNSIYFQKARTIPETFDNIHLKKNFPDQNRLKPTQEELVEIALQSDVNTTDSDNMTALHFAVLFDDEELVKKLIEKGANPNIKNINKTTPIMMAKHFGYKHLLKHMKNKEQKESLFTKVKRVFG